MSLMHSMKYFILFLIEYCLFKFVSLSLFVLCRTLKDIPLVRVCSRWVSQRNYVLNKSSINMDLRPEIPSRKEKSMFAIVKR